MSSSSSGWHCHWHDRVWRGDSNHGEYCVVVRCPARRTCFCPRTNDASMVPLDSTGTESTVRACTATLQAVQPHDSVSVIRAVSSFSLITGYSCTGLEYSISYATMVQPYPGTVPWYSVSILELCMSVSIIQVFVETKEVSSEFQQTRGHAVASRA